MPSSNSHAPTFSLHLPTPEHTHRLGAALGAQLVDGLVVALVGELGAGKTALAKAAIASLGSVAEADVTSPTYVLAVEYEGRVDVLHVDAYRLDGAAALEDLGLELTSQSERAVLIEWADRVEGALPLDRLTVELEHADPGRDARLFSSGPLSDAALKRLRRELEDGG